MRVLFSSTSGHGHVIPMLQLGRAFRQAGHELLWALSAASMPLVTDAGLDAVPAGAHGDDERALRGAVLSQAQRLPGEERPFFVFPRMFGEALTPPMAADLLELAAGWQPDLIVHDQAELAAPLVGEVRGIPTVTHSFGTAVPPSILEETATRLAGLWHSHGLEVLPYAGCYRSGYLDICPPSLQGGPLGHLTGVQRLRPVTVPGRGSRPPGDPLVYVTMGTAHNDAAVLREVVDGVARLPVRVLVAVGPRIDPAALGSQPAHVRVEAWVDQLEVLSRTAVVVSHGGSGTFFGGLAHGLPQLCLPQAADQFRNAEGGTRAGASLALRPGEVSAESVREAVERLLADPDLRAGAQRVAAEIAAMPSPESVVSLLASQR
jgi:UDP:flavonoid glycosyltransferase YjiC (YdhE family)